MNAKLGILGLGSKSTIFYIEQLNNKYNKIYGAYASCPFVLLNTNFNDINSLLPFYSKDLDNIVNNYLNRLLSLHVDEILVPNITLHETIDIICERESLEASIIHPLKETISQLKENNIQNAVLFGSYYTMNSNYIASCFNREDINIIRPSSIDIKRIDDIRKEVYLGKNMTNNVQLLAHIIENYAENESILIACTELSLINASTDKHIYDMARIHINSAIQSL